MVHGGRDADVAGHVCRLDVIVDGRETWQDTTELLATLREHLLGLGWATVHRIHQINVVVVDDVEVRSRLLNEFQIEIGGGLGPLAGKIWRIGLMGETAKKESIQKLMDAFRKILN